VTTIRLRQNGPYVVDSDDIRIIDWNGVEYDIERRPVALCRCGASARKPFCDGSHSRCGFQAAEAAGGRAGPEDAPAT
jgi:CDGSH-type Zn-finger protein